MVSGFKFQVSKYTKGTVPFVYLLFVLLMAFTSCSKDEDDGGSSKSIVGTWVNGDVMFRFDADGTGDLYYGDVWGDIRYNMQGTTVYMRITYVNSKYQSVSKGEKEGFYNREDDTFRCDGKVYKRE